MHRKLFTLIGLLLLLVVSSSPVMAQNQQEMNREAKTNFEVADKELNLIWKELMSRMQEPRKEKLVASQVAWIKYRDTEVAARVSGLEGGSMAPLVYYGWMASLTETRIHYLRQWMEQFSY